MLQESVDEADPTDHFELDLHEISRSTGAVAQTLSTSAPRELKEIFAYGTGGLPAVNQQKDPVEKTRTLDKKLVSAFVLGALAAVVFTYIFARTRHLSARKEKALLAYPVSTDNAGLRKTLELVEKSARRLRNKWNSSSADVREAFMKLYSPQVFVETFTEEQNRFWCDKYSGALRFQHLPGWAVSEAGRREYALRNILLTTVFRAAEIRLDYLIGLEKLSVKHRVPSVFSADSEGFLPRPTAKNKKDAVSFQQFTRRLEKLGLTGVAQEGDSGPKVSSVLADDLANVVAVKAHYDNSNAAVIQEFEKFLASVEQVTIGKSEKEVQCIENIAIFESKVPFPVSILAQTVERAKLRRKVEQLSVSQILGWSQRARWNDVGVSAAARDVRVSQETMLDLSLDAKQSALDWWGHLKDIHQFSTHLFTHAIALL